VQQTAQGISDAPEVTTASRFASAASQRPPIHDEPPVENESVEQGEGQVGCAPVGLQWVAGSIAMDPHGLAVSGLCDSDV
jgi:hypothetical protein